MKEKNIELSSNLTGSRLSCDLDGWTPVFFYNGIKLKAEKIQIPYLVASSLLISFARPDFMNKAMYFIHEQNGIYIFAACYDSKGYIYTINIE